MRLLAVVLICLGAGLPAQNLFKRATGNRALIADHRATAVGDILTVVIREAHKVKNEDKVARENNSSLAARLEAYTLSDKTFKTNTLPRFDVRQDRVFEGEAKQEKDSSLEARVAVIVVDVLPNGNMVVAGTRIVTVDDEEKTLRISGLVRPLDVSKDNTVPSSSVADARVAITSVGGNARTTTRGPIGTVFDTLVWAAWPF
jgi:flagellar L-ring protein precursor FlgH